VESEGHEEKYRAAMPSVLAQNQITGDPAFTSDGYHITAASAAMDAGIDIGVTTDLDGHLRPYNTIPDIGADEVIVTHFPTDTASSLVHTDAQGVSTVVQIPAGAVTEPVLLSFTPILGPLSFLFQLGPQYSLHSAETITAPVDLTFAGRAFDLNAYRNGTLLTGLRFSAPITVTLHYVDTDVAGVFEGTLVLEYWNEDASEWEDTVNTCTPPSLYNCHSDENWLAVPICHLTRFALFGREEHVVYLPLVLRTY
jgi:hypothetical protein